CWKDNTTSRNTVMMDDRQKVIFQPSVTSMLRTRTPAVAQHSVAPTIRAMPLRCSAGVRIRNTFQTQRSPQRTRRTQRKDKRRREIFEFSNETELCDDG